ncbi:hypothetical protein FRX31_010837, partial [Thalictrum thalictroides]
VAEEVDFSANDITATGLKFFDSVLQSNIVLNTLNLSGNRIEDEGAKEALYSWSPGCKFGHSQLWHKEENYGINCYLTDFYVNSYFGFESPLTAI